MPTLKPIRYLRDSESQHLQVSFGFLVQNCKNCRLHPQRFFFPLVLFAVCFLLNFLFCIGAQPINNVVIVSNGQQRESGYIYVYPFSPQTPLPFRLPHNVEQSSWCCTVGPFDTVMCTCPSQLPKNPFPLNHKFVFQVCESVSVLSLSTLGSLLVRFCIQGTIPRDSVSTCQNLKTWIFKHADESDVGDAGSSPQEVLKQIQCEHFNRCIDRVHSTGSTQVHEERNGTRIIVIHCQDPGAARLSLACSPGGNNDFSRHSPL